MIKLYFQEETPVDKYQQQQPKVVATAVAVGIYVVVAAVVADDGPLDFDRLKEIKMRGIYFLEKQRNSRQAIIKTVNKIIEEIPHGTFNNESSNHLPCGPRRYQHED